MQQLSGAADLAAPLVLTLGNPAAIARKGGRPVALRRRLSTVLPIHGSTRTVHSVVRGLSIGRHVPQSTPPRRACTKIDPGHRGRDAGATPPSAEVRAPPAAAPGAWLCAMRGAGASGRVVMAVASCDILQTVATRRPRARTQRRGACDGPLFPCPDAVVSPECGVGPGIDRLPPGGSWSGRSSRCDRRPVSGRACPGAGAD